MIIQELLPNSESLALISKPIGNLSGHIAVQMASIEHPKFAKIQSASPTQSPSYKDELDVAEKLEQRLQELFEAKGIVLPTMVEFARELRRNSHIDGALKLLGCTIFSGLLTICGLTSVACTQLLRSTDESVLTAAGANLVTNSAGLLGMFTDMPAIAYLLYLSAFQCAHKSAHCTLIEEAYDAMAKEFPSEYRDELYRQKVDLLGQWKGIERYLSPDSNSKYGSLHAAMQPMLKEIDRDLRENLSLKRLLPAVGKTVVENLKMLPAGKRYKEIIWLLGKGSFCLGVQAYASWLILACGEILAVSEYDQFFSDDPLAVNNATNYYTNVGALFPSMITLGLAFYIFYMGTIQKAHHHTVKEIISKSFTAHPLSDELINNELRQIKKMTSKFLSHS